MTKKEFTAEVLKAEKSLYHIAKSILRNDEDCADAMQNAILQAYSNESYQMIRSRKLQVPYEEYMEDQISGGFEGYSEVYLAVSELPELYRVPFVLHYVEGYSVKEAGQILKLSDSAVKVRLHRARNLMKEKLKGGYGL